MPDWYRIRRNTLSSIANAIRNKIGNENEQMTPLEMPDKINSIENTVVDSGYVVKSRNENGRITEVDFYGTTINSYDFGQNSNIGTQYPFRYLEKINVKDDVTIIKSNAFSYCSETITDFDIPETVTTIERAAFYSMGCPLDIVIPQSVTSIGGQCFDASRIISYTDEYLNAERAYGVHPNGDTEILRGCTRLRSVLLGSIGHPCTTISRYIFKSCTQTDLTITAFCRSSFVDTLVANLRAGAINATIVIKASEETTYNGVTYSAGDTILTSVPESAS